MKRPTRSSQGLTACETCRRHVVAAERPSETSCPFCAAPKVRGRGHLLAASILALGLSACGGGDGEAPPPADDSHESDNTGGGEDPGEQNADNDPPPAEDPPPSVDRFDDDDGENRAVALYGIAPE